LPSASGLLRNGLAGTERERRQREDLNHQEDVEAARDVS
jgi:hypothetical protein